MQVRWGLVGGTGGGVAILLAALLGVLLLRRPRPWRGRAEPPEPEPTPPAQRVGVRPVPADGLDVTSRDATDRPEGFRLPGIDIVARPDPAPLAEKVQIIR